MALAAAIVVFVGFACRRPAALSPTAACSSLVFTAWLALLLPQTLPIAAHRPDIHRRVGVAGAILAAMMVIVGVIASVDSLRRGVAPPGLDPRVLFAVPMGSILAFAPLVAGAIILRRKPAAHKR